MRDTFSEGLRKVINKDLFYQARVLDTDFTARYVDENVFNHNMYNMWKSIHEDQQHLTHRHEDYDDMQKALDKKTTTNVDARSFDLDQSVEKIYFDYYGEGFTGLPYMDHPGTNYKCPCGQLYMMSAKLLPPECTRCHRLTPIGKLQRDGVMKRV